MEDTDWTALYYALEKAATYLLREHKRLAEHDRSKHGTLEFCLCGVAVDYRKLDTAMDVATERE